MRETVVFSPLELNTDSDARSGGFCTFFEALSVCSFMGRSRVIDIPTCAFYGVQGIKPYLPFQFIRFYMGLEDQELLLQDIYKH